MTDMVERVAKALAFVRVAAHSHTTLTPDDIWRGLDPVNQDLVRFDARAALAAMREPTEAMSVAGGEAQQQSIGSWGEPKVVWRAMIDEARQMMRASVPPDDSITED